MTVLHNTTQVSQDAWSVSLGQCSPGRLHGPVAMCNFVVQRSYETFCYPQHLHKNEGGGPVQDAVIDELTN